jgi:nitrogen regulatory protein P-II 1
MKKIAAIIKPFKLEEVKDALGEMGVDGMTVSEVKGTGHQNGRPDIHNGSEYVANLLPMIQIEIVVADQQLRGAMEAIVRSARTGKFGDGKVFVSTVESAIRIRTEEKGELAL